MEGSNELEDADLNSFLIFGILLLDTRLLVRVDALVEPVDNNQSVRHVVELAEGFVLSREFEACVSQQ